jgi:GLPGLI family protein
MGKEFLIKDSLTSLAWKMEAETSNGGYTCYKACKKPSTTDFRNMRLRKEDADKRGSKTGS